MFFGGSKGGGKSYCGIGWLIKGNLDVEPELMTPVDVSYCNSAHYRALVLRENQVDMDDWVEKARRVYEAMGARLQAAGPTQFIFPTGARIVVGHLADAEAWRKYAGQGVVRIFIDELTFIKDIDLYFKVLSCCRAADDPKMKPQMFLTGNPGGPGTGWVKKRFIKVQDRNGNIIPPLTTIGEKFFNPILGKTVSIERVYIPSKIKDNIQLVKSDPMYVTRLMMLPEAERRAYLDGDWDALSGLYFNEFRPEGPLQGEPPHANHVIKSTAMELMPWWHRWIGGDWGYKHMTAIYGACQAPDGRVHIYRELAVRETGSVELGVEIARQWLPDLKGVEGHAITFYLSPDAFGKRDAERTIAQQIATGIAMILGPGAVVIEGEEAGEFNWRNFSVQANGGIRIMRAQHQRIEGWQYVKDLLRWRPIQIDAQRFNPEYAARLFQENPERHRTYMQAMGNAKPEVLPGLLIHDCCRHLIASIPEAIHKEGTEDIHKTDAISDDVLDAIRYTLMAHKRIENAEPLTVYVERAMTNLKTTDPTVRFLVSREREQEYRRDHEPGGPVVISRLAGRRGRAAFGAHIN